MTTEKKKRMERAVVGETWDKIKRKGGRGGDKKGEEKRGR